MKFRILLIVFILSSALTACGGGAPDAIVEISGAWARPALAGSDAGVYMALFNHATKVDFITGGAAEIADAVELRLVMIDGNQMQMLRQDQIKLPANTDFFLRTGSYHIMLISLKQDLVSGDTFEMTVHFENSPDASITVTVIDQ